MAKILPTSLFPSYGELLVCHAKEQIRKQKRWIARQKKKRQAKQQAIKDAEK